MSLRIWIALGLLLALVGWWFSPLSPRVPDAPRVVESERSLPAGSGERPDTSTTMDADGSTAPFPAPTVTAPQPQQRASSIANIGNPLCPPPPRVSGDSEPLQSPVPAAFPGVSVEDAAVTPLAGFSIEARVLSRRDYAYGREARYSPTDLALGWGRMREDAVLQRLDIEQRGRWYHYRWGAGSPPIPSREIAKSSANMHLIPADAGVATALARVRQGQRVRIDGWLVELSARDGWRWRSSLTRDDQGAGGCEVIYACSISSE